MKTKLAILLSLVLPAAVVLALFPISSSLAAPEDVFSHKNSKGTVYYLYEKEITLKNTDKKRKIYFFSKSPTNDKGTALSEVPEGKVVGETKNGLPVLKNQPKS